MTTDATDIVFGTVPVPDETPLEQGFREPYDPMYPDSTPEAPYGYKKDGTPYQKRPKGTAGGTSARTAPAREKDADSAAWLLARLNGFIGIAFTMAGMPESAATLAANNDDFQRQAKEALLTDPQLCKKILSVGATSGKAGLAMAYVMLGAQTFPTLKREYRENHPKQIEESENGSGGDYDAA